MSNIANIEYTFEDASATDVGFVGIAVKINFESTSPSQKEKGGAVELLKDILKHILKEVKTTFAE